MLGLTRARVAGEEATRAELNRANAFRDDAEAALADARVALRAALVSLAVATGADATMLDSLRLSDHAFAAVPDVLDDVETLVTRARTTRGDLESLRQQRDAARWLAEAARADVRPISMLAIRGGVATLYDSPFFRYFPDEQVAMSSQRSLGVPADPTPARFNSPRGFGRSLMAPWQPFVTVGVTVRLPAANDAGRGRVAQAQAALERTEIEARDFERGIHDHLVALLGGLRQMRDGLRHAERAVEQARETQRSVAALYSAGELTLLDALLTEQALTDSAGQLVAQEQQFFAALARLSFEAGDLVQPDPRGSHAGWIFNASRFVRR
jgi:outer membrane protein TolC